MRRIIRWTGFAVIALILLTLYEGDRVLSPGAHKALLYALILAGGALGAFCIVVKGEGKAARGQPRD